MTISERINEVLRATVANRVRENKSLFPHKLIKSLAGYHTSTVLDAVKKFHLYKTISPDDFAQDPESLPLTDNILYADSDTVNARLEKQRMPNARCVMSLKDPQILYISEFLSPQFLTNLKPLLDNFMAEHGHVSYISDDNETDLDSRQSRSGWASTKHDDELAKMLSVLEELVPKIAFSNPHHKGINEDFQIVDYSIGGKYDPHYDEDHFPTGDTYRISTALFYLESPTEGGATEFPELGLTFTPKAGDLLLFSYGTDNGMVNPYSLHAGTPIIKGQKRIMTLWTSKARPE